MLALLCIVEAAVFYGRMFGWHDWGSLAFPALVTLLPPLVFALGSGWLLGRLKPWLLYVWMAAPVLLAVLPLPEVLGLWDGSFFTAYPLTLEGLGPGIYAAGTYGHGSAAPVGGWCSAAGVGGKKRSSKTKKQLVKFNICSLCR